MPTENSLAATLFIAAAAGRARSRTRSQALVGLDEHVILHIGPHAIRAAFEPGRSTEERISAVQYTRYPLSAEAKAALLDPGHADRGRDRSPELPLPRTMFRRAAGLARSRLRSVK